MAKQVIKYIKFSIFVFLVFLEINSFAQLKELISKDGEVDLPYNKEKKTICLNYSLTEYTLKKDSIKGYFKDIANKYFDNKKYYFIQDSLDIFEYFIVYPCTIIDSNDLSKHNLNKDGLISASLFISFQDSSYSIEINNFEWIMPSKKVSNLSVMLQDYKNKPNNIKNKIHQYSVLKSAEYLLSTTLENYITIVDEIISLKSNIIEKNNNK